jgi:hypothetical protein
MPCPIPYMQPKPGAKAWRFVHNPDKNASPQVSAALSALVDKYGDLKAAIAAGWQFVEESGQQVAITKASGPHHFIAPGGRAILTSGMALSAIDKAPDVPKRTNAESGSAPAKRARSVGPEETDDHVATTLSRVLQEACQHPTEAALAAASKALSAARTAKAGAHNFKRPPLPARDPPAGQPMPAETRSAIEAFVHGKSFCPILGDMPSADVPTVSCYVADGSKTAWEIVKPLGAHGRRMIFVLDCDVAPSPKPFSSVHTLIFHGYILHDGATFLPMPAGIEPFGRLTGSYASDQPSPEDGLRMPHLAMIDPTDGSLSCLMHAFDTGDGGEIYGDLAGSAPCAAQMDCYGDDDEERMWGLLMRRAPILGVVPRSTVETWCAEKTYSPNAGVAGVGLSGF